jgi:tripartite-type tricarboxylate transporter receptor subunit TctC
MKKLLALSLLAFSSFAFANTATCNMLVPFPPGGAADTWARALQRANPNIQLEYKPGAFSAVAANQLERNKDHFFIGLPTMYSAQNPNKNISTEMLYILYTLDATIVTSTNLTLKDLATKDINIGVWALNSPQHSIALQLKEVNPRLNIVPLGGDAKALPIVANKEVEIYITSPLTAAQWETNFKHITEVITIPFNKEIRKDGFRLSVYNMFGVFIHKDATADQRKHILNCVETATSNPQYVEDIKKTSTTVANIKGEEKDKLLEKHISVTYRKFGL